MSELKQGLRRRARFALALGVAATAAAAQPAAGQDGQLYERGRKHWIETLYDRAFPDLRAYRRSFQGRTALVDYMIGTSACRLPGRKEFGFKTLDWLIYAYPLAEGGRARVKAERDLCMNAVLERAGQVELAQMISAGVTGRGKTFHWAEDNSISAYPIRRTREIPVEEFWSRLAAADDEEARAAAVQEAGQRLVAANVVSSGGYVIASKGERSDAGLQALAGLLDRFSAFQFRTYGMVRPPFLITVYLTDTVGELRELARRIHGLDVSPSTIGYSFADDMSVVAVAPRDVYGTVLHELTHLLIRGNFGDAPQWIDEGVASLYEVSSEGDGDWRGEPNWRGRVLQQFQDRWPRLDQVITSPWFSFDDPEHSLGEMESRSAVEQAVLTAYNRYFLLYLQEREKLPDVFAAVRDHGLGPVDAEWQDAGAERPGTAQGHVLRLVERTLGADVQAVDADFRRWLGSVLHSGLRRPDGTQRVRVEKDEPRSSL